MESVLTKKQKKRFGPKRIDYHGEPALFSVEVRYDDECGNGHNTFAITGDIYAVDKCRWISGGCLREEIEKHFPELAHLIKWHLVSSDGPMYYIQNTVYQAGVRDCWGKVKGEPRQWETQVTFGKNPIKHKLPAKFVRFLEQSKYTSNPFDFEVLPIAHKNRAGDTYKFSDKYTFGGYADKWHECPFDTEQEALDFLHALQHCEPKFTTVPTVFGEGKERELDHARSSAVWPEATVEDLTAPGLEDRLRARLPGLLAEFKTDVEGLGFTF